MYQSWYVANLNLLSPAETAAFMSWIQVLENDGADDTARAMTLAEIDKKLDLNLQIYLIPWLVRSAMRCADNTAKSMLEKICVSSSPIYAIALTEALRQPDQLASRALSIVEAFNTEGTAERTMSESDYASLEGRVDILTVLAVLYELGEKDIPSDRIENFIRDAAEGYYGRYSAVLACQIAAVRCIQLRNGPYYALHSVPDFYLYPDLIYAMICTRYSALDDKTFYKTLLSEIFESENGVFSQFQQIYRFRSTRISKPWFCKGGRLNRWTPKLIYSFIKCLWTNTALLYGLRRAERAGAEQLRLFTVDCCAYWQSILVSKETAPWIDTQFHSRNVDPPLQELIPAVMASPVLAFMMRAVPESLCEETAELMLLPEVVLNFANSVGNVHYHKKICTIPASASDWSYSISLYSLVDFTFHFVDQATKGYLNRYFPSVIYDMIINRSMPILRGEPLSLPYNTPCNDQQANMHKFHNIQTALHAAYEEGSGNLPWGMIYQDCWLGGDEDSLAFRLCRLALTEYALYLSACSETNLLSVLKIAITLAYERFPQLIQEIESEEHDWMHDYLSGGRRPSISEILRSRVSGQYPKEVWQNLPVTLRKRNNNQEYYMPTPESVVRETAILLYIRIGLFAAESEHFSEENIELLEELAEFLSRITDKSIFSRNDRFLTAETLESLLSSEFFRSICVYRSTHQGEEPLLNWLATNAADIVQTAISTVLEMGSETVFYQYRIAKAIVSSRFNLNQIGIRLHFIKYFFMLMRAQCAYHAEVEHEMQTAFQRIERNSGTLSKTHILKWFICALMTESEQKNLLSEQLKGFATEATFEKNVRLKICKDRIWVDHGDYRQFSFRDWDPDTLAASQQANIIPQDYVTYPAQQTDAESWEPLRRDFIRLMCECNVWDKQDACKLVLISSDEERVLVSAQPGINYQLEREDWDESSWEKLRESVLEAKTCWGSATGLYLYVYTVKTEDELPLLCLEGTDEPNLEYENLFGDNDYFVAREIKNNTITKNGISVNVRVPSDIDEKAVCYTLTEEGWNRQHQRKRTADLKYDDSERHVEAKPENVKGVLEQYLNIQGRYSDAPAKLKINHIKALKGKLIDNLWVPAWTEENIPVLIEMDSIALNQYQYQNGLVMFSQGTPAIVETRPDYKQLPTGQEQKPNGMIWRVSSNADQIEIYYLSQEEKGYSCITVSSSEFLEKNNENRTALRCGLPVVVDAETGSVVSVQKDARKQIIVRLLWNMEAKQGTPVFDGKKRIYIGEYRVGDKRKYLVQDIPRRKLDAYDSEPKNQKQRFCGVDLQTGKAVLKRRPNFIQFAQNNHTFFGKAQNKEQRLFNDTPVFCRRVYAVVSQFEVQNGNGTENCYDIQRYFSEPDRAIRGVGNQKVGAQTENRQLKEQREAFLNWQIDQSWIRDGNRHAHGIWQKDETGLCFLPDEPLSAFPLDPASPSLTDCSQWIRRIPMHLEPVEMIELYEDKTEVYAQIVQNEDGTFEAFPQKAVCFNLQSFMQWMTRNAVRSTEGRYTKPLTYVHSENSENETVFYFEMYLGFMVAVPESCLLGSFPRNLFFGDTISHYTIQRDEENRIKLYVEAADIRMGLNHRLFNDTNEKVVQYLEVSYQKERSRVSAARVLVRRGEIEIDSPANFVPIKNGRLTPQTEEYVRSNMEESGKCVLVCTCVTKESDSQFLYFDRIDVSKLDNYFICLRGQDITETKTGNDYRINFTADPAILGNIPMLDDVLQNAELYVTRRHFSYHEGALRMLYRTERINAFNRDMLVAVKTIQKEDGSVSFACSLKSLPAHLPEMTVRWLRKFGEQHITFRALNWDNTVSCEVSPGVFCTALVPDDCDRQRIQPKTAGRLYLKDGKAYAEPIAESDHEFVSNGRPAELLIMDEAIKTNGNSKSHFSIAGLPGVMAAGVDGCYDLMIQKRPPRFGILERTGIRVSAEPAPDIEYAFIDIDESGPRKRIINRILKNGFDTKTWISFEHLSFLDGSISDLIFHINRGKKQWHYHDKTTMVKYTNADQKQKSFEYVYADHPLPVIVRDQSLRYPAGEIRNYAFLPHEIREYGIQDGFYPIACGGYDKIYLELTPGRIVTLYKKQIFAFDSKESRTCHPQIQMLRTGDQVYISTCDAQFGVPKKIILKKVRYSLRDYILKNAYLPVVENGGGKIILGSRIFGLCLPVAHFTAEQGSIVRLDNANNLQAADTLPKAGDCIMLRLKENGELRAEGFPDANLIFKPINKKGQMIEKAWFCQAVTDPQKRGEFFQALGGLLPAEVLNTEVDENGRLCMTVFYPQPSSPKPSNDAISAQIVGAYNGVELIMRAGAYLFKINLMYELHVTRTLAEQIIACDAKNDNRYFRPGNSVWVCCPEKFNQFRLCLYPYGQNRDDRRDVQVLFPLDSDDPVSAHGFLCRDLLSQAFLWMPLRNVVRTDLATAKQTMDIWKNYKILFTDSEDSRIIHKIRLDSEQHASWLSGNVLLENSYRKLERIHSEKDGGAISVIVDSEILNKNPDGRSYSYLCHERPVGNIYTLRTEQPKKIGDAVFAVPYFVRPDCVRLFARDEVRTVLNLSPGLIHLLHRCFKNNGQLKKQIDRTELQKSYQPMHALADAYKSGYETGLLDVNTDARTQLFALFGKHYWIHSVVNASVDSPEFEEYKAQIRNILSLYLKSREEDDNRDCMTFAETVAVCGLLSDFVWKHACEIANNSIIKQKDSLVNESLLLQHWLLRETTASFSCADTTRLLDALPLYGKDTKGSNLCYAGMLDHSQMNKIRNICNTIRHRNPLLEQKSRTLAALCILRAVNCNELDPFEENCLDKASRECLVSRMISMIRTKKPFLSALHEQKFVELFIELLNSGLYHIGIKNEKNVMDLIKSIP